jgi:hypothetical protein
MPCYSNIQTVLLEMKSIEAAAALLGIKIEKRTANAYTLRKGNEYITIQRSADGQKFETKAYSGSGKWDTEIMQPLVKAYAKEQIKVFAKKSGYTLSAGSQPDTYVLTSFR